MKTETAKGLEAILEGRRKQAQVAVKRASEQEKAQAQNLVDFEAKKEKVIKPAFQELVDLYKTNGFTIRIAEEGEHQNIRLDMTQVYPDRRDPKPEFRLTFDKRTRTLSLYTSTGSQAGPAGSVSLDDVTADWIQKAFLKYEGGTH
jgi:hypothetical protein